MPFSKDPDQRESEKYCSYCFKDGKLCYEGTDVKEFQKVCYENMVRHGMNKYLAKLYTFLIRFAPRWKKQMRDHIRQLAATIEPFDTLEADHIANTLAWIDSSIEIFRIAKPATPPKHLVSYFVLIDPSKKKVMLVDHIKAGLWLPAGGHVEKDEHPRMTVEREIQEELQIPADFIITEPLFLTQTITIGQTAGHTDVTFWYIVKADSEKDLNYDPGEFNGYNWFDYNEILKMDITKLDPHMHRFMKKFLASNLAT